MTTGKRRDLKNRILKTGESQIKQGQFKGRYQYDWTDQDGQRRHCNSWRLTEADPLPAGKRMCKPLRTLEEEIADAMHSGIDLGGKNKTLNELFNLQMELKQGLKPTTQRSYFSLWNTHVRDSIGKRKVCDIKYSDISRFYNNMLSKNGLNISSIGRINTILKSVFALAIKDNIISSNPADGAFREISKTAKKNPPRHALTKYEQETFLTHIKPNELYYLLFVVLFGTGMRIGEATGLIWSDVHFDDNYIEVNRNLQQIPEKGNTRFYISTLKTVTSHRIIPILPEVRAALIRLKEIDMYHDKGFTVDGVTDFVFLNRNSKCYATNAIDYYIKSRLTEINKQEKEQAQVEGREPNYIRKFSVHNCRHTFITRLCEKNVPLKVIQAVAGHKDIQITMNIYAEATQDMKFDAFKALDGIL